MSIGRANGAGHLVSSTVKEDDLVAGHKTQDAQGVPSLVARDGDVGG